MAAASAKKNPFDLAGRGGPGRAQVARVWTAEEQAEKLKGYLEIPPEHWDQIRYGTHVRYYTKADGFRSGGFVLRNPFDVAAGDGGPVKRSIKLQTGFVAAAPGYVQWQAAYEDITKIFVKPDAATLVMMDGLEASVRGLNANIRKLLSYSEGLERRLAQLEKQ